MGMRSALLGRRFFSSRSLGSTTPIKVGEVATLHELGLLAGEKFGSAKSLGSKKLDGTWDWQSFAERAAVARKTTSLLQAVGVRKGDRVAVISKNRKEWASCAYGTYGAGAAFVPMYEQQRPSDWEYILRDSETKVLFVSRTDLLEDAMRSFEASKEGKAVFCFDDGSLDKALREAPPLGEYAQAPSKDDLATLIYTSGTTGKPKGVELTHWNLTWNAVSVKDNCAEQIDDTFPYVRSLSILPWAHIYGQTCELHGMLAMGAEVALAGDATTFLSDCKDAKPTVVMAVPALYNRIYDNFQKQRSHMPTWKQGMVDHALALGDKKSRSTGQQQGSTLSFLEKMQLAALDRAVLSKVREALGGGVRVLASGGAALSGEVRVFLEAVGFKVSNGYGLTETSPVLTQERPNSPRNRQAGSIGRPLPGVGIKTIDEQGNSLPMGAPGEIVVSGPGVMRGYWRKPEETAEVLSSDRDGTTWFKTGDRGIIDTIPPEEEDQDDKDHPLNATNLHVRIVGRIKEQYKLANGKYVVPTPIEEAFARSRFISQVFLYGDNRPFNVALVSPDWTALEDHVLSLAAAKKKKSSVVEELAITQPYPFNFQPPAAVEDFFEEHHEVITTLISKELHSHNVCKSYEFPKKWTILTQGFNVARSMLTPKLSLRRNVVYDDHKDLILNMYDEEDAIHEATFHYHGRHHSSSSRSGGGANFSAPSACEDQQSMKL